VRFFSIVLVALLAAAFTAMPAAADPPRMRTFSFSGTDTISDVCSFPVDVAYSGTIDAIRFFDANGAVTRQFEHFVEQDTFTANGKTLASMPYTYNREYVRDSSGALEHVYAYGIIVKVPLPDGTLFIAAGWIDLMNYPDATFILSPDRGNPGNVAAFCAALAP
jgi:hypothetical protein